MSRSAYSFWTCPVCNKTMRNAGLARVSHLRKHVREGLLTQEIKTMYGEKYPRVVFYLNGRQIA